MLHVIRMLYARDFSPCSESALPFAVALARRLHADLHVVYVDVQPGLLEEEHDAERLADLQGRLGHVGDRLEGKAINRNGLRVVPAVLPGEKVAQKLIGYAIANDIDIIVMGTHGHRGLRHLVLGSVAEEVVRTAPCPVLTVRTTGGAAWSATDLGTILVPVDFSHHATDAVRLGKEIASLFGVRLDLLHVVDHRSEPGFVDTGLYGVDAMEPEEEAEESIRSRLVQLHDDVGGTAPPIVSAHVRRGVASSEIVRHAVDIGAGLIVMATHGNTGLSHLLMGSVAERVVRAAPCPVFTVKSFGKSLLSEAPTMGTAGRR